MKFRSLLAVPILALALSGCAHQPAQAPIPGAINNFDSSAYQTLRTAHGIAQSLSDQSCSNNNKPGCRSFSEHEKAIINQFINDLNTADVTYSAYHNGAATQAAAQSAVNKVSTDQANLPVGGK